MTPEEFEFAAEHADSPRYREAVIEEARRLQARVKELEAQLAEADRVYAEGFASRAWAKAWRQRAWIERSSRLAQVKTLVAIQEAQLAEARATATRLWEEQSELIRNTALEETMAIARRWSNKSKAAVCEAIHEDIRALIQKPEGANG